jgi:hypothetical protein
MQGGMLSLGIALNQACQGIFSGSLSDDKILSGVMSLIPVLEGTLGAQFVQIKNNQALYYLDTAIKELVLRNPRVNERMIIEHAKGLGKRDNVTPFVSLSMKEINELVRSRMVRLATAGELNRYLGQNQRISIDSFHDPSHWRIEKKEIAPVKPIVTPPPSPIPTLTEQQVESQKIEKLQREAWKKWQTDFGDYGALNVLLEQSYHTKHGLSTSIKFEIADMLNHILMAVFEEHRKMTQDEYEKFISLRKILGEAGM